MEKNWLFSAKGVWGGTPFAKSSVKIINLIFETFPKAHYFHVCEILLNPLANSPWKCLDSWNNKLVIRFVGIFWFSVVCQTRKHGWIPALKKNFFLRPLLLFIITKIWLNSIFLVRLVDYRFFQGLAWSKHGNTGLKFLFHSSLIFISVNRML